MGKILLAENSSLRDPFPREKIPFEFSANTGHVARRYHRKVPGYNLTPLHDMKELAEKLGVGKILIKDESSRFGLKAFKALGASFAIGRYLCYRLGYDIANVSFDYLRSDEVKNRLGRITFATASDGNHGRGLAWSATRMGFDAVVYLPKGTVRRRVEAIEETGAKAVVTDKNYDDTVSLIAETADKKGWVLIQDTAFGDYTTIPIWIMQGYCTMGDEIRQELEPLDIEKPTHVFLQAGVGSMAAALLGFFLNNCKEKYPLTYIVEPHRAACFYESVIKKDNKPHPAEGDMQTMMAGLSCGVPSTVAWSVIHKFADGMLSCDDSVAADGMRLLADPSGSDPKIISGESGAVTSGLINNILSNNNYADIREKLRIDDSSIILLFNTEGDTDPENYRNIVESRKTAAK